MTRHQLRLSTVVAIFLLAISLLGCSGSQPSSNQANTNQAGSSAAANSAAKSGPPAYEGFHDITDCNAILAWAWDKNHPNDPVKLDIYDGNLLMTTVTADEFRQDLLDTGHGNGKHGVVFPVPPQMKDGKKHAIMIKVAGTSIELANGPKELKCTFDQ